MLRRLVHLVPEPLRRPLRGIRDRLIARTFPRVVPCTIGARPVRILVGVSTLTERFRVETLATKEPETLRWLETSLGADGDGPHVLFDVGANIGLFSLYAAALRADCRVFSFEPGASNFAALCANVARNGYANVTPCNMPVSDGEAFGTFFVSDIQAGAALHSFGAPSVMPSEDGAVGMQQGALSVSLDDLVLRYGLPQPTLVKIDVDGIEDRILRGAASVLGSPVCRSVLVEWNYRAAADTDVLVTLMRSAGLELAETSAWESTIGDVRSRNFIFRRGVT